MYIVRPQQNKVSSDFQFKKSCNKDFTEAGWQCCLIVSTCILFQALISKSFYMTFIKLIKHSNKSHLQPSIDYSLIIWDNQPKISTGTGREPSMYECPLRDSVHAKNIFSDPYNLSHVTLKQLFDLQLYQECHKRTYLLPSKFRRSGVPTRDSSSN